MSSSDNTCFTQPFDPGKLDLATNEKSMKNIIVVEDNDLLRDNICEILELDGYQVYPAENGEVGWQRISTIKPDLILSDVNMPVMDGLELLQKVRLSEHFMHTPFIFLTVRNTMKELRVGMKQGADDYLAKPFDIENLLETVRTRLKRSRQNTESSNLSDKKSMKHRIAIEEHLINPIQKFYEFGRRIEKGELVVSPGQNSDLGSQISDTALSMERNLSNIIMSMKLDIFDICPTLKEKEWSEQIKTNLKNLALKVTQTKRRQSNGNIIMSFEDTEIEVPAEFGKVVFSELLENAIKFSHIGQHVDFEGGYDQEQQYEVRIRNYGSSFPQDKVDEIDSYVTFHDDVALNSGIGLGLSNAVRILDKMGANWRMESLAPYGTLFSVTFM